MSITTEQTEMWLKAPGKGLELGFLLSNFSDSFSEAEAFSFEFAFE